MLPTLVIGLREGLEAALIVGIIAAFLRTQGRRDLLRSVFAGVAVAVLLCAAVGTVLDLFSKDLPQKQQEGLETVIGVLAVGMVTYMVVWMKRHSRELKGRLESMTCAAIGSDATRGGSGAGRAMVLMAFLAVLREGIETVVFLIAVFNQPGNSSAAASGAVLGILLAVALGYGIYRGGVRINLSKFFRATGFVLVLVAAGLVVNALHTAHEAGWLNIGQGGTFDLTWLVNPGSVQSSLLTGMLGLQPRPVVIEVIGWLAYLVPVATYVGWPPGHSPVRRTVSRPLLAGAAVLAVAGVVFALVNPSAPAHRPSSNGGSAAGGTTATASGRTTAAKVATVSISAAHGCRLDTTTFAAGGVTFKVQNKDATAVSEIELLAGERILGEKENVPPGLAGQFVVNLTAGTYTVYCPGASPERSSITVVGTAANTDDTLAALLKTATTEYKNYVDTQLGYLVTTTKKLDEALHGTDVAAAKTAYLRARPFYEKVEPVAESFVVGTKNLDAAIDARVNDVPRTEWSGFHLIEQSLWVKNSLAGMGPWGDRLVADVEQLQRMATTLSFQAPDLANGAQGLLDEVASTKITGEEDRYSHLDVLDMANNVEGSEQAYADLQPVLEHIDPALSAEIGKAFAALDSVLAKYRTSGAAGYVLYPSLTTADKRALAAAVKAVAEPLSRVAGKVANG